MLLCVVKGAGRVFEESVEAASEVTLEAASGLAWGLALADALRDVGPGCLVMSGAGHDHQMQRPVELSAIT